MQKPLFFLALSLFSTLLWAETPHSGSLNTPTDYKRQLYWSKAECQLANPQFSPHEADDAYRQLDISPIQSLNAQHSGQKVHLHGQFSPRKENHWVFQDDMGSIPIHFRSEWHCNANSAAIQNSSSPAHLFGTFRQISPKARYIEADYYQQDNLFGSPLGWTLPDTAFLSRSQLEKLANQGFTPAQTHLAKMYALGKFQHFQDGISEFEPNPQQAVHWWQKASENQDVGATMALMWAYDEGYGGLSKNREHALALLHKKGSNRDIMILLNQEEKAKKLWKNQQHQDALAIYLTLNEQFPHSQTQSLGELYFDLGDYQQAHDYLEKNLAKGHVSAAFARLYVEGLGVVVDVDYGMALLKHVADGSAPAALALADYYAEGRFVAKNPKLARKYYQQALKMTEVLAHSYEEDRRWYQHARMGLKKLNLQQKRFKK